MSRKKKKKQRNLSSKSTTTTDTYSYFDVEFKPEGSNEWSKYKSEFKRSDATALFDKFIESDHRARVVEVTVHKQVINIG